MAVIRVSSSRAGRALSLITGLDPHHTIFADPVAESETTSLGPDGAESLRPASIVQQQERDRHPEARSLSPSSPSRG